MREGRWVTVTESEFDHERRGLDAIREKLPDFDPWRAWSNFTFTANTGHIHEVDLLVVAPGDVCMIELEDWHGSVTSENGTWVQTTPGGRRRTHGNPPHLVNRKAKELAGLLVPPDNQRVWGAEAVPGRVRTAEQVTPTRSPSIVDAAPGRRSVERHPCRLKPCPSTRPDGLSNHDTWRSDGAEDLTP